MRQSDVGFAAAAPSIVRGDEIARDAGNQQVLFLSDGSEDIRQVREYLHPNSEHVIDCFHITIGLTVLQQQAKALEEARQERAARQHAWKASNICSDTAMSKRPQERSSHLLIDLELTGIPSAHAAKLAAGVAEFETYIRNNQESIPNYGERYRQGYTISTAFVESTINQVVNRRFLRRHQMQWTLRGAHLLLQTRCKVFNNELEAAFRRWYPLFRVEAMAA